MKKRKSDEWFRYERNVSQQIITVNVNRKLKDDNILHDRNPILLKVEMHLHKKVTSLYKILVNQKLKSVIEIAERNNLVFAGKREKQNGYDLYFYCSTENLAQNMSEKFEKLKKKHISTLIMNDEKWGCYLAEIYPTPAQEQQVKNKEQISQMVKHGDQIQSIRRVNHYCAFFTEITRMQFESDAREAGCAIGEPYYAPERTFAYGACVHKRMAIDIHSINEVTDQLVLIANKNNGVYEYWDAPIIRKRLSSDRSDSPLRKRDAFTKKK